MSMSRFKIRQHDRIGYEYISGETTKEFVDYWSEKSPEELSNHVFKSDIDKNSPPIKVNYQGDLEYVDDNFNWFDMDDIERLCQFDFDGKLEFVRVDKDGNDLSDYPSSFSPEIVYVRNGCFQEVSSELPLENWVEKELDRYFPVFSCISVEKGSWSEWIVECELDDFYQKGEFSVGILRTHTGDMIERLFYRYDEVEEELDYFDGIGKWEECRVGWSWMNFSQYYDLRYETLKLRPNHKGVLSPFVKYIK